MYQNFEIRFLSSFTVDLVIIFGKKVRQVYKTERDFLSCSAQRLMRRDSSGTPSLIRAKTVVLRIFLPQVSTVACIIAQPELL